MGKIKEAEGYDAWWGKNGNIFESEALAIEALLPKDRENAIEIGCGTGILAARLGIPFGIEPSAPMADLARQKGIDVLNAPAEDIPFGEEEFSLALLCGVISYVDDVEQTFKEAHRILEHGGSLVVAFLQRGVGFAKLYDKAVEEGQYPEDETPEEPYPLEMAEKAQWRSVGEVFELLHKTGFTNLTTVQTLTVEPKNANKTIELPKPGHDRGSWVVVRGIKRYLKGNCNESSRS